MSHICGMFARRAFNVDGIVCLPVGDRSRSAVLLAVADDERLGQLMRQLGKLEDVIEVARAQEASAAFVAVSAWVD
jgi:acetolactate synthase-1/3 small subunit